MSKKIFIITGESSGDKIASLVIKKLKEKNLDIQILAIGGENIKLEKIDCIFDIKDIAYMGCGSGELWAVARPDIGGAGRSRPGGACGRAC